MNQVGWPHIDRYIPPNRIESLQFIPTAHIKQDKNIHRGGKKEEKEGNCKITRIDYKRKPNELPIILISKKKSTNE